ncbi:MAG: hypothetical protein A2143_00730 [Gallionellales bacterium RBG_16_57_15]|nr:MAG: hypothetical protein A2143_00730 [Gallionellales bacterium RBG_16_57_15]
MVINDQSTSYAPCIANIQAAIANLAPGTKYIVMNAIPAVGQTSSQEWGIVVAAFNAQLAAVIPAANLLDIFAVLTAGTADGTIQLSWMNSSTPGEIHLNTLGYYQVAKAVQTKLAALGV